MNYNFTVCETFGSMSALSKTKTDPVGSRSILGKGIEVALSRSIDNVPKCWDVLVPEHHLFLRSPFLKCLEDHPPRGMGFCYLMFHQEKKLVGIAACQILHFNADASINNEEEESVSMLGNVGRYMRGLVAKKVDFNTFICGNLLLTGEHGYYFDEQIYSKEEGEKVLAKGLEQARKLLAKEGIELPITFLKDYFEDTKDKIKPALEAEGYHEFTIQPNMIFELSELWQGFDDYTAAMTSKYRVRAKRALKKAKDIRRHEMTLDEIREHQEKIYELYLCVAQKSGFNSIILHPEYFTGLKEALGAAFRLTGYFEGEKLVAYFTTINCGNEMEAHFLGYDLERNYTYALYHNMLFDIVRQGIQVRTPRIVFARTALEIKSSVGAVAHDMFCYIKHRSSFSNKFIIKLFDYLNKPEEWTPRHPFK